MQNINNNARPSPFTRYLASPNAVSHCLAVGVLFLLSNYQNVLYRAHPDTTELFTYPYVLKVFLAHVDAVFFGFATAIIMFQSPKETLKIFYCFLESVMVFLNYNRKYITENIGNADFAINTFIAGFSGVTLYFLGTIAKKYLQEYNAQQVPCMQQNSEGLLDIESLEEKIDTGAYLKKYAKLAKDLKEGLSISVCVKKHKVCATTVQKVKSALGSLEGHSTIPIP